MAFGKISRFSPSFSWREAAISAKEVLLPDQTDEKVRRFEHQFASYIGVKHAVMVPSARYGFYLLLRALGVGEEMKSSFLLLHIMQSLRWLH